MCLCNGLARFFSAQGETVTPNRIFNLKKSIITEFPFIWLNNIKSVSAENQIFFIYNNHFAAPWTLLPHWLHNCAYVNLLQHMQ